MRAGVIALRKLQHVLEEHGAHDLVLPVGEAIGVQRDPGAADDREQSEADPGSDQDHQIVPLELGDAALRICQRVDDAAEQYRLHEHR